MDLGSVFEDQNDKNSIQNGVQKYVLFQHRFLNVFFRILTNLGPFWEPPGLQKIIKN